MNNLKPWNKRKRTGGVKRKLSKEYAKADAVDIYKPVSFTNSEGSAQIDFDQNIADA